MAFRSAMGAGFYVRDRNVYIEVPGEVVNVSNPGDVTGVMPFIYTAGVSVRPLVFAAMQFKPNILDLRFCTMTQIL